MCETWKPVVGYEGYYEVSDLGRVRSVDRYDRIGRFKPGRVLRPNLQNAGYHIVHLYVDGVRSIRLVHRAVIEAFRGFNNEVVDHLNGNKTDNRLSNLECVTQRENTTRGVRSSNRDLPTGVIFVDNQYRASFRCCGEGYHIGVFEDADSAHRAYLYAVEHGPKKARNKFIRRKYVATKTLR